MRNGRGGALGGAVGPVLARLGDLADGETRLVPTADPRAPDVFIVRRGDRAVGYVNDCPHRNLPLDLVPGRFLDRAGAYILCVNHGARFDIDSGACVRGPCAGRSLTPVALAVADGAVRLAAETAGRWRVAPRTGAREGGEGPGRV